MAARPRLALAIAGAASAFLAGTAWLAGVEHSAWTDPVILLIGAAIQAVATLVWALEPRLPRISIAIIGVLEVAAGIATLGIPLAIGNPPSPGEPVRSFVAFGFFGFVATGFAMVLAAIVHPKPPGRPSLPSEKPPD